jgi:hypothetical protein
LYLRLFIVIALFPTYGQARLACGPWFGDSGHGLRIQQPPLFYNDCVV